MFYSFISFLINWIFPTKKDRGRFRTFCREIDSRKYRGIINNRYIDRVKELNKIYGKQKIKVVFLSSESTKWSYQSLYEELENNPNFEVQILITVDRNILKNITDSKYEKLAKNTFSFFKNKGMNVVHTFDFTKKKYVKLKKFNPNIIFYEQPQDLSKEYSIKSTSKYALSFYCSYGSNISNGKNEYIHSLFKDVYGYYLDNHFIKEILLTHDGYRESSLKVCGNLKLDTYLKPINYKNIIWRTNNKKRIVYAPHYSFYKESLLGFGTFDWNYNFFLDFASDHPEFEFIIKPHPQLKEKIVSKNLMSKKEMFDYFKLWESLPNGHIYEGNDYFDMFRTSDLLITDCNSFLLEYLPTEKPVIHLIGKYSVGHNYYGRKITSGYYEANDMEELKKQLDFVLMKNNDPLLPLRKDIIARDILFPKGGVAKSIANSLVEMIQKINSV